jgi:transposase
MRRIREVLRLRAELGTNLSAISAGAKLARSTVRTYLDRAATAGLDAGAAAALSDAALEAALYPPSTAAAGRTLPDWAEVDQDLRRHKHVTRKLLWMEYRAAQPDGLGFSQFKLRLSEWQKASGRGLSMRQVHHAGETVQVDYAGDTVAVMDKGAARAAQIFVACLPCSGLIYAEASWTQTTEDWLGAHVRLFAFLGGVPAKVVPDNLKVGVTHASYYDPVINASYAGLVKHYGTAVVPARSRKPRDKSGVENGVLQACRWLLAPLRHRQFFSLAELNQAIALLLGELNDKPMAPPREGSRRSLFDVVERAALKGLPIEPYVVGHWAIGATVNLDYTSRSSGTSTRCRMRWCANASMSSSRAAACRFSIAASGWPAMPAWPDTIIGQRWANTWRRRTARWPGGRRTGCAAKRPRWASPPRPTSSGC